MKKIAYLAGVALLSTGMALGQSTAASGQNGNGSNGTAAQSNTGSAATDQNANAGATGAQTHARHGKKLPQTASPLPLFFLLGAGMLGLGGVEKLRSYRRI
jgi:hypothetical protein